MASAKDLRKRISSVKNTQQITKAMKMVSAAKLRRAQSNVTALRPYSREIRSVIQTVVETLGEEASHPLLEVRKTQDLSETNLLLIVVTSDRGLCGGFNSSIIKSTQRFLKSNGKNYKKVDLAFVGKKAYEFFRSSKTGKYYQGFFNKLDFLKSKNLSEELISLYTSGEYGEIKFIYNEFKSAISQVVTLETLLPITLKEEAASGESLTSGSSTMTLYEPDLKSILESLLPKYFAVQTHRVFLESLASEHGARMSAMENATKNAGEMIRKITLLYNKTRQAGITKELLEIVSGTEAQKG